jgi:transposase
MDRLRQVVDRSYAVCDVAERLGVSSHGFYKLVKAVKPDKTEEQAAALIEPRN